MSQQFVLNWFNAKTVKRNVISIRTISKLPTVALVGEPNRFESKNIPSYDYEFRVKQRKAVNAILTYVVEIVERILYNSNS